MNPYRQNQIFIGLTWLLGVGLTLGVGYFVLTGGLSGGSQTNEARPPQDLAAIPTRTPVPTATPRAALPPTDVKVGVAYDPKFIWPAQGNVTSEMGPEHPSGIDIGLTNNVDSPIYAVAEGRVSFAGGGETDDFGFHIILDHGNAITTMYAHLSEIWVKVDDVVPQGKILGLGGATGTADGKHLHFELRGREGGIDPLDVLPEEGTGRTALSGLSCDAKPIPLDRGASAVIDFQSTMLGPESIAMAQFTEPESPNTVSASTETRTRVKVTSTLDLSSNYEQSFELAVALRGANDTTRTVKCVVTVKTERVAPSFYVRAARPGEVASGEPEAPVIACHPSYSGGSDTGTKGCIRTNVGDYDCYGNGDGPNFVSGRVRVVGADEFGLDKNRDGIGCDGQLDW